MLRVFLSVLMTTSYLLDVKAYNIVLHLPNFNETENLTVNEDYDIENRNHTNDGNTSDYFYINFPKIGYEIFKNKMAQAMEIYESFMNKNPVILKVDKTDFSNNGTLNLTFLNNNMTVKVNTSFSGGIQQKPETESPFTVNSTEANENPVQNISGLINVTSSLTNYSLPALEISDENKTASNETSATTNKGNKTTNYGTNNNAIVEGNKTTNFETNNTVNVETNVTAIIETNKTENDVVKKPEVVPVGFFGKVSNTVTNIFHSLTSWF